MKGRMEPAVGCETNGNGTQENERLRAMLEFEKNVEPGEYIECDLYRRGDESVLSELVSTGDGSSKTQKEEDKASKAAKSPKVRFVSPSFIGKKIIGFVGKLTSKIDCFGRRSNNAAGTARGNEAEGVSPNTADSSPASAVDQRKPFDDGPSLNVNIAEADQHTGKKAGDQCSEEESVNEVDEDLSSGNLVDETPRRVRSKVDDADDLTVVGKGTVTRTLKKLQSTGSYVFKQTSFVAVQHAKLEDEHLQADHSSLLHVQNSMAVTPMLRLSTSGNDENSSECRLSSNDSLPRSTEFADGQEESNAVEENGACDADSQVVAANDAVGDDVQRSKNFFEDDTRNVGKAVVPLELLRRGEKEPSEHRPRPEIDSPQRPMKSEDFQAVVVDAKNGGSVEGTDSPHPAATTISYGIVKEQGTSFEKKSSDMTENMALGNVRKVTALTVDPELFEQNFPGAPELVRRETAPEAELCEQAAQMSLQELSRHLSGRVDRIKSLFDSQSDETMQSDVERGILQPKTHICAGLSCDSAVFDKGENKDVEITDFEVQSKKKDTRMDEGRDGEVATTQVGGECLDLRGDDRQRYVDRAQMNPEVGVNADEAATELATGGEISNRASLRVDGSHESSSSTAHAEDLSHSISHLLRSCSVM